MEQFLAKRGLELSHEKTSFTPSEDGFDFLGQTVRRYPVGKVLLRPSKKNVKTFLAKIREVIRGPGRSLTAGELIQILNTKIKGWALYHRHAVSKRTFQRVDHRIFPMLWRWCRKRHRQKSPTWIKKKYFRRVGERNGVFTGAVRDSKGKSYPVGLLEAARVRMVRPVKIHDDANPYDPSWEGYLEERRHRTMQSTLLGRQRIRALWRDQQGRCPVCGQFLKEDEPWQVHHRIRRSEGGGEGLDNLELLHANCHRQRHSRKVW